MLGHAEKAIIAAVILVLWCGGGLADIVHDPSGEIPVMGLGYAVEGMPEYDWWYGCSPTSGGMLMGFWDSVPGYEDLYYGDASIWDTNHSMPDSNPEHFTGTHSMVASWEHHTAGQENGMPYGYWGNSPSYPDHAANPNCIADFMQTVSGGTSTYGIVQGLMDYAEWDNPATPVDESYQFDAWAEDVTLMGRQLQL